MKSPTLNAVPGRPDESPDPSQHFVRRPSGERQQEDPLRSDAALDELRDAMDERSRLAGAGPGDDEEGTVSVVHRRELSRVEV